MFASDQPMATFLRGLISVSLALSSAVVCAQADKEAEQVKRLKLQMRQVQQQQQESQEAQAKADQARLQAEKALKAQDSDLQKERVAASGASRKAAALARELETLKAEHARVKAEAAELLTLSTQQKAQLVADKAALDKASATETRSSQERAQLDGDLQQCVTHNAELANTGLELLTRYEQKGVTEVLSAQEPFVQTGRVKLENLKAEYTRRVQALRLKPKASQATQASPAQQR
jgi:chromosome segregation ATPase